MTRHLSKATAESNNSRENGRRQTHQSHQLTWLTESLTCFFECRLIRERPVLFFEAGLGLCCLSQEIALLRRPHAVPLQGLQAYSCTVRGQLLLDHPFFSDRFSHVTCRLAGGVQALQIIRHLRHRRQIWARQLHRHKQSNEPAADKRQDSKLST